MRILLALLVSGILFQNTQFKPEPGNPSHQEPPPGWSCVHSQKDPSHNCECKTECVDGDPNQIVEDKSKCLSYCYQKHCHCPIYNCP